MSEFGDLVRRLREERGMSQERLAKESGLTNGYISLIETGKRGGRIGRDAVLGIAQAFKVDPTELLQAAGRLQPGDEPAAEERPSFEAFVQSDPALKSDQKKMLVDLYRSWVKR